MPFLRNTVTWKLTRPRLPAAPRLHPDAQHTLSSLRPDKIRSHDYVDLSGAQKHKVYFDRTEPPLTVSYRWSPKTSMLTPFPPHARGYLYYHPPPLNSLLAGSIRLRVGSNNAPGSDLLLPNGLPWQVTLPELVKYAHCATALSKLLQEGLVSPETVDHCRQLFSQRRLLFPEILLLRFDQPFALAMDQAELRLIVVGRDRFARFTKQKLFGDPAPRYPFKGRLVARFELSPDSTRCFIRILRVVTPVECVEPSYVGKIIEPKAGDYLTYRTRGALVPWSLDLTPGTSLSADALRLLLDDTRAIIR